MEEEEEERSTSNLILKRRTNKNGLNEDSSKKISIKKKISKEKSSSNSEMKKTTNEIYKEHSFRTSKPWFKRNDSAISKLFYRELQGKQSQISEMRHFFKKSNGKELLKTWKIELLIDEKKELLNCTLLGWTRDGNYLISYKLEVRESQDDTASEIMGNPIQYSLQFWKMEFCQKLKKVLDIPLFGGNSPKSNNDLGIHLKIMETNSFFLIHGYGEPSNEETSKLEWITLMPWNYSLNIADLSFHTENCFHFSFTVCSPYPSFTPKYSFVEPNLLLFNLGNAIHVFEIELPSTLNKLSYQFYYWETKNSKFENDVYFLDSSLNSNFQISKGNIFNVEKFIMKEISNLYSNMKPTLSDYEIDIIRTFQTHSLVVLYIITLLDLLESDTVSISIQMEWILLINLQTGEIVNSVSSLLHHSNMNFQPQLKSDIDKVLPKMLSSFPSVHFSPYENPSFFPHVLTNESVFTEKSLNFLFHPFYPLVIKGFSQK